ncbi:hypothetical protein SCHPADRAFT_583952 [Schizopora paradoxa]|uniref:Uncharacterized protein n=1 Tax=Schizopora paradoxa TaxID=27342 RepID=A0A0H2RB28_9AGAM|nr:hypothetical protein SCHPADRAFT_583952 [Schizopora paradoxa]
MKSKKRVRLRQRMNELGGAIVVCVQLTGFCSFGLSDNTARPPMVCDEKRAQKRVGWVRPGPGVNTLLSLRMSASNAPGERPALLDDDDERCGRRRQRQRQRRAWFDFKRGARLPAKNRRERWPWEHFRPAWTTRLPSPLANAHLDVDNDSDGEETLFWSCDDDEAYYPYAGDELTSKMLSPPLVSLRP